ncbi:unnamed protein product [Lampetra planeri]
MTTTIDDSNDDIDNDDDDDEYRDCDDDCDDDDDDNSTDDDDDDGPAGRVIAEKNGRSPRRDADRARPRRDKSSAARSRVAEEASPEELNGGRRGAPTGPNRAHVRGPQREREKGSSSSSTGLPRAEGLRPPGQQRRERGAGQGGGKLQGLRLEAPPQPTDATTGGEELAMPAARGTPRVAGGGVVVGGGHAT